MAIKVPVIISYDKKGTKQAITGIGSLEKAFKKMGVARKLTLLGIGAAVTKFTKDSVTMALADDKANKMLTKTLKNLGLGYAALPLTDFVDKLQRATGVSEDKLRPALQKLLLATGDVTKSQNLLNVALDISAATGKSVESSAAALSKAYLGNTKALFSLGTGISKAELKTLSFEQQVARVTALVGGQAATAAGTYAGAVDKLSVAANEAQETIGKALIDSLVRLGAIKTISNAGTQMQQLADNTANAINGVSLLIAKLNVIKIPQGLKEFLGGLATSPAIFAAGRLGDVFKNEQARKAALARPREGFARNQMAGEAFNKAQSDAAEKARKKALADAKALLALKKQSAAADKLKAIFDMDIIQLTAAKQGKLSAEELARVNALIAIKTATKVDDLTALNALEAAQKANADAEIKRQDDILNAHKKNAAEILALNKDNARAYADFVKSFTYPGGLFAGTPLAPTAGQATNAVPTPTMGTALPGFDVGSGAAIFGNPGDQPFMPGDAGYTGTAGQVAATPNVTVNLQGGINIGSTYEFYQSVQAAVQAANTAGNSLSRAGS
jgi:hypothetical protein